MDIRKSSGNLDVLDSGTLFAYSYNSDIEFEFVMDDMFTFNLILQFENDGKDQHSIKSSVDNNKIFITCINFDNVLGTGTSRPIELAVFEGKKIYLNFWVYSLGKKSAREVSYTIYKEK